MVGGRSRRDILATYVCATADEFWLHAMDAPRLWRRGGWLPPAYQPVCSDEQEEISADLEDKGGVSWDSKSTEIIPTNTRSFVVYMSLLLLSLSANILLVMENAKLRIAHIPAKTNYSK